MTALLTERRILSFVLLMMTVGLVYSTFGLEFADLGGAFSPMFFPRIILMILLGLALLNVVLDIKGTTKDQPMNVIPVVLVSIALMTYVLILVPLGYFLSSVLVGSFILITLGLRHPLQVLGIPLLASGLLVALFNHTLKMPLPTSPFVWWL